MSQFFPNRHKEDEDFWKDVSGKPKKKTMYKTNSGAQLDQLNTTRQVKFESFLNKYRQKNYNMNTAQTMRMKIHENVDKMLLKEKRKAEKIKKTHEEQKQNKEKEEIQKCTFRPNINQYPKKKALESPHKIKNSEFYEKSIKWFKSLKGKRAQKKQQIEYSAIEYTFRPEINDSPLAIVFNKTQLEAVLPQNIYFLKTKENNKRKRQSSSTYTLPNANDRRNKTTLTSRSRSLHCSIDVLKNELRNTHKDRQFEEEGKE